MKRTITIAPLLLTLTACSLNGLGGIVGTTDNTEPSNTGGGGGSGTVGEEPLGGATHGMTDGGGEVGSPPEPCLDDDSDGVCNAEDLCEGDIDHPHSTHYQCERTIYATDSEDYSQRIDTQWTNFNWPEPPYYDENAVFDGIGPLEIPATADNASNNELFAIYNFRPTNEAAVYFDVWQAILGFDTRDHVDGEIIDLRLLLNPSSDPEHNLYVYGSGTITQTANDALSTCGVPITDSCFGTLHHALSQLEPQEAGVLLEAKLTDSLSIVQHGYTQVRIAPILSSVQEYESIANYDDRESTFHSPEADDHAVRPRLVISYKPTAAP